MLTGHSCVITSSKLNIHNIFEKGPDRGCEPEGRDMHTVTWGKFASGRESLLIYGGVVQTGKGFADFWHVDLVSRAGNGMSYDYEVSYFDEVPMPES